MFGSRFSLLPLLAALMAPMPVACFALDDRRQDCFEDTGLPRMQRRLNGKDRPNTTIFREFYRVQSLRSRMQLEDGLISIFCQFLALNLVIHLASTAFSIQDAVRPWSIAVASAQNASPQC
ncbi:hypothetical protein C8J56DRAFT_123170 [Mycena floridula]|nr:hypothetical protein C8J56DRAFT_123170 [Mycena floridula]